MEVVSRMSPRTKIALITAIFIGFIVIISLVVYLNSRRSLTVITDTIPITLELNNTKKVIKSKNSNITLESGSYNYRVSSPGRPTLAGTFDLTEIKNKKIEVKYNVYAPTHIKSIACKLDPDYCNIAYENMNISFFEDYSWVIIGTETIDSKIILSINENGEWKLMGYTGEAGYTPGIYPLSIEEEINQ